MLKAAKRASQDEADGSKKLQSTSPVVPVKRELTPAGNVSLVLTAKLTPSSNLVNKPKSSKEHQGPGESSNLERLSNAHKKS